MKRFRTILFWCHLAAGVIAGLVILVMSVTGALLTFEPQILAFADRDKRTVAVPGGNALRLGPQSILEKVRQVRSEAKPSGLTMTSDPAASVSISLGREGTLFVDPYTGRVLGEGSKSARGFFRLVEDWHRWLGTSGEGRATGRAITGVCNIAFLFLACSGLYIWWPKKWSRPNLKAVTVFSLKLKGKARDFNWHNSIGFWSAPILIVLTATGMVMSYQWANNLLYTLTGSERPAQPPQQQPGTAPPDRQPGGGGKPEGTAGGPEPNLDQLWERAAGQALGWRMITLRLPVKAGAPAALSIDEGKSWNPIARSQLTLNATTAEVVKWEPYAALSAGRQLRSWVRVAHTGEAAGIIGQILAGGASLGGGFLVWTGLALSFRRFRAWLARRGKETVPAVSPISDDPVKEAV